MKIAKDITELVGNTPIVRLNKITKGLYAQIFGKLEFFNPGSSVKDRIAKNMIETAEKQGLLMPGATLVEPTSGNTGVALAYIAAQRGYRIILTMPESFSMERRKLLALLGAEIVLTPAAEGMTGAINRAKQLIVEIPGSYMPAQFENPANPEIHYKTTGPEIWNDMEGQIDIFVAGVGTGGTITGTGKFLKEKNPSIKIVAVEPDASPVLSGGKPSPHKIQGIGAGFIPAVLDTKIYDEVIRITNDEAYDVAKQLSREEGIFVGISSGANVAAAIKLASREENKGKKIVTILCDTGERYLSVLLNDQELKKIGASS